jgi:hypothetical protein
MWRKGRQAAPFTIPAIFPNADPYANTDPARGQSPPPPDRLSVLPAVLSGYCVAQIFQITPVPGI